MKRILLFLFTLSYLNSVAQIPTNGLVAFYPFNGNANDESGNNNHGTIVGATLTSDRYNNPNSAYLFDGINDFIKITTPNSIAFAQVVSFSVHAIVKFDATSGNFINNDGSIGVYYGAAIFTRYGCPQYAGPDVISLNYGNDSTVNFGVRETPLGNNANLSYKCPTLYKTYHAITAVRDALAGEMRLYFDGQLVKTILFPVQGSNAASMESWIGKSMACNPNHLNDFMFYKGTMDEVAIYNRVLSQSEINDMADINVCHQIVYDTIRVYDTVFKYNNIFRYLKFESYYSEDDGQVNVYEIQAFSKGVNVAFQKPGYANSYEWGDYSNNGISAVDNADYSRWSSNRNDPGPDTLNPHFIVIDLLQNYEIDSIRLNIKGYDSWDQCFNFLGSPDSRNWYSIGKGDKITGIFTYEPDLPFVKYDTVLISVTDTLFIDLMVSADPVVPENINTIKIYPNPANDFLIINTGNYTDLDNYSMKIINSVGIIVFETKISQPLYEINLSSWSGKGIYVLQVYNAANAITAVKKIILR